MVGAGPAGLTRTPVARLSQATRPRTGVYGLGTDIAMSFDQLIELPAPIEQVRELARFQRLADHACRGEIDIALRAADGLHGVFSRHLDGLAPLLAREGIGIAGIHHERTRAA